MAVHAAPSQATKVKTCGRLTPKCTNKPNSLRRANTWALKLAAMPNKPMPMATACNQYVAAKLRWRRHFERLRVYSDHVLGMTASRYRAGGAQTTIRFAVGECSLGSILVAQSDRGICAILMGDDPDALVRDLQDTFPKAELIGGDAGFEDLVAKVVGLIEVPSIGLDLPLDVRGTAFQERVWQALREVPPGSTTSYAEIAERIGSPKAVRAVAQAELRIAEAVKLGFEHIIIPKANMKSAPHLNKKITLRPVEHIREAKAAVL